ncbi:MAG TPA: hypothetical protein VHM90_14545 [Phycisphaerae bacterium]|jgi:hypothetical protein|nr:hypothetical protein [Phycisphaerae bacterium]
MEAMDGSLAPGSPLAIKVLDPRTRRFHAGVVHAASDGSLEVELSGASGLKPGAEILYSLADRPFVAARAMRNAVVKQVARIDRHLRVALAIDLECAAA